MQRTCYVIGLMFLASLSAGESDLEAVQAQNAAQAEAVATKLRMDIEHNILDARKILQQVPAQSAQVQRDAIADTLAEIAISAGNAVPNNRRSIRLADYAIDALGQAAMGREGVPYAGAADRLLRIAEAGGYGSSIAASHLGELPEPKQALQYVRQVAIADTRAAGTAVYLHAHEMGSEGLEILEALYRQNLVVDPNGQHELEGVAAYHGWN